MDNIINNLIGIDKKARKIVEDAEITVQSILESIQVEKKSFDESYKQRAQYRIERIREEESNDLKISFKKANDSHNILASKLEKVYEDNHDRLEKLVFDRVINEIKNDTTNK